MAENFWDADKPASKDAFWSDDKSAAQQDLPAGVAPSTAGGGRGVLADPRRIDAPAPAPVAQGNPMGSGFEEMTSQPAAPASVLEGVDLPEPTVSDAQQAENVSLSNRRYAERTPQVTDAPRTVARQDSRQVQDSRVEGLGLRVGDQSTPVRIVGQAVGQGAEALGGLTRAVGDAVGSRTVADFGANAANNAQAFQDAIGKPRTGTDFNPRGPMPYLAEQFENAGSSLATSYATARAFGAKAVIPLLSVQDGAQYYNQARQAGRTPGEALALAIPHGTFEALGEKFEGLDKAMGAMQVLLTRGAPRQALESAGKILIENGIKEVPGEVFTYLGQSGLDNLPGIGINRDMTMGQWLDGLRDTVVQAGMMGTFSGGAGAISHIRAEAAKPREKTPEELAREKGFLVREEQAKRLAAAGDKEVAAGLQRQVNTERSDQELSALRDQPWAKGDVFEERYKQLRADGKAPAEAAARAAMANAYAQIGKHLSLNDNAFRKAADAAATLPMEKVPQFFEQVTANLVKKGMSQPVPEGTIGGAVSGARDAAVEGAMTQVYGEQSHSDTVKGILDMEAQQEGAAAAPAAEPAAAPRETEGQQPGRSPLHPDDLTPNEAGAHAGASSPLNDKTATREQILAGNAPLGHMTLGEGSPGGKTNVSIENAAGSVRTDIHNEPPKWSTPMENGYHYGYIRRTEGNDGDKFDVFVKEGLPENWAGTVWVVDQASRDGKFDEHKGVIGPQTEQEARDAYLSHYEKGWTGLRAVTPMPWAEFKQWVHDGKKTEPANPAAFAQAATPAADAPAEERGGRAPAAAPAVGEPARAAGEDAGPVAPALRLGKMPNNAEAVTLAKDGTVMIGKYAAVDYDSGEPVVLKPDANESQIKHALHNAGAVPAGHKFFGGAKEAVAPAPKPKQNAAAQDSTTAAPSQGAGSQQASAATPPAASAAPSTDERTQEAPPTGGKVTPSHVWENTLPKDRERYVLEAGWKKGSPKTTELVGKAWSDFTPVQKEKLAAAIGKATPAAAAALPAVKQQLSVLWGGRKYPVESLEDAARKWDQFRQQANAGASELGSARIVDQDGKEVARIAYNGNIFPAGEWKPGTKPLLAAGGAKQTAQQRWDSGEAARAAMLREVNRADLVAHGAAGYLGTTWEDLSDNLRAKMLAHAGEPMPKAAPKPVTPQIPPAAAPRADKAEIRPVRRPDGSIGYEAVPIAAAPAKPTEAQKEAALGLGIPFINKFDTGAALQAEIDRAKAAKAKEKPTVSANTVFTDDAAAAARARLRKKLGTLNQGLDPETMLDGITLAGYHIEKGARTFAAYAKAMLEDLGDAARPYLKSWYMGVKYDPRAAAFSGEMSSAAFVDEFDHTAIATPQPGPAEAAAVENEAPSADTGATDDSSSPANPPADDSRLAPVEPRPGAGGTAPVRGAIAEEGEPAGRADDGSVRQQDERAAKPDDAAQGLGDGASDSGVPNGRNGNLARSRERDLAGDYRAPAGALTREGSWLTTAKRNVDLIELALKIEAEKRAATPEEQAQLAKYVGFGAGEIRNKLFPVPHQYARQQEPDRLIWPNLIHEASWKQLAERLDKLPREWQRSVLQSTQYAHYTSENVVRGIWSAVQRLGFTGGKILEPGTGIGNFAMVMPESMRRPKGYTGIEMDGPTALIARLLSPAQNMLHEDFIKRKLPRDFFDLAIGNPPFSQTKILGDPDYEKHGFMLHDFFFAKTIDRVRPGGLLVFVTSKGTMDKQTDRARKYLSDRADLLGAIRLPSTAFEANAGTSVVTDVIFLRKRDADAAPTGPGWMGVSTVETKDGPVVINEYFAAHPQMVLGQNRISGGQDDEGRRINSNGYGGEKYTVVSYDKSPEELDAKFAAAVQTLPANVYSVLKASPQRIKEETRRVDYDPKVKREGVVYMDGKTLMRVESGVGRELKLSEKDGQWMGSYVGLRDLVHVARQTQAQDGEWEPALKALNKAYDAFVKKHGPINDFRTLTRKTTDEEGNPVETTIRVFKNKRLLREDYDHALMISLEQIDEAGKIKKSPFLGGRTIGKPQAREVKTIGDALAVSLDETGHLDLADVGRRLHITPEEAIEALGTNVYKAPSGQWQLADEYLSGDVVAKLEEAQTAAGVDPSLERNIEALKAVQPDRLGPSQISVKLGASWVPAEHVSDFAKEIGAGAVTFDSKTETWQVQGGNERSARRAGAEYGTAARSPSELLEAALNSRQVVIKAKDADKKEVTDTEATTAANEMLRKIKERFKSWVWQDTDRASTLVDTYNRRFNNIAPRRFDGSHLTLPGVSLRFKLHPHQLRAIWRQIQTGNTYLAHAVGAGKTIEMIAGGMEQRRLGLIKKPIYAVPNHMLEQFSNEFMELYPLANIMVADDENFSADRRKAFIAAATMNGPDAIIITHSAFERIGVTEESVAPIRDEILSDLESELDDVGKGDRVRRSQLEQQIEAVTQRFDSIVGMGKKDNVVPFEEMGVDFIYADEAHAYRKLDFTTNQKIKGIDPSGSRRALDMYVKTRILQRRRPGRAFAFASGTPVTNTMGELYTLMRFFQPEEMDRTGISSFDSWARQFGEVGIALEANAAGRYENVTRFSKFDNVPELMSRVRQFMDVLTSEHLGSLVKRPDLEGGKPNLVMVEATSALKSYMKQVLSPRIEASRKWKPSPQEPFNPDPMLAIISDGRFAALDPRFFGGKPGADESTKLDEMAARVVKTYHDTADNAYVDRETRKDEPIKGSTQIVFYNLGFGAGSIASRGFDARAHFTKQLVAGGIKRDQILWFDDASTDAKKEAMFQAMRNGSARVLIGSAKKMGTGVNVQKRLVRLHYFDPPWFPADVEQPHGRIIRQGNQNPLVGIDWYATKGAYDSTMWQMVARKQRFIDQAFTGDKNLRSMEDMSEASQYEQAAAMASGDPRALQLAGYKQDLERLERLQAAHANEQIAVRDGLRSARYAIDSAEKRIAQLEAAQKVLGDNYFQFTKGTVGERAYDKLGEFGQAVKDAFNRLAKKAEGDAKHSEAAVALGKFGPVEVVGYPSFNSKKEYTGVELVVKVGAEKEHVLHGLELGADADPVGLGRKLVNHVNGISTELDRRRSQLRDNQADEKRLAKKQGVPFEHQQEMLEKNTALKQLEDELRAEGEADAKAAAAAGPVAIDAEGNILGAGLYDVTDPQGKVERRQLSAADVGELKRHKWKVTPVASDDGSEPAQFAKAPLWRSDLREAVGASTMKAAPAAGWQEFLSGLGKRGVKPDEIEWSGIRDWLKLQPGKVSKEQVLDYLRDNGVHVTEVLKGGEAQTSDADRVTVELDAMGFTVHRFGHEGEDFVLTRRADGARFIYSNQDDAFIREEDQEATEPRKLEEVGDSNDARAAQLGRQLDTLVGHGGDYVDDAAPSATKYGQYTLPGGANYRELLLTLPQRTPQRVDSMSREELGAWYEEAIGYNPIEDDPAMSTEELRALVRGVDSEGRAADEPITAPPVTSEYVSAHWNESNILAHIRMNDRVDADGKRVLFIEEVQSDWAQQGRRNGFMPKDPKNPTDDDVKAYFGLKPNTSADIESYREEMVTDLAKPGRRKHKDDLLPRAPFVDKTDAWLSLALKRVIRLAAEEGYDRVAFVNGKQSADRYGLSTAIKEAEWHQDSHAPFTVVTLMPLEAGRTNNIVLRVRANDSQMEIVGGPYEGKSLPDLVGKGLAEKIMSEAEGRLRGLELDIGGEGMVAFYDKIVPAALNKLLPKLGGAKTGVVELQIPSRQPGDRAPGGAVVGPNATPGQNLDALGFDVSPAMRELAGKGMPLFARGDAMPSGLTMQEARDRIRQMRGATVGEVEPIVRKMTADWKGGPQVHVVATYRDLPPRLGAPAGVRGVHSHGEVWIVAASHRRGADLREAVGSTLAHEAVAHYGLRKILGDDFDRLLTKQMRLAIASGNKPMRELRDFVRQAYRDADGTYNLSAHQEADEMAALAVEKAVDANGEFRPGYSWLKSVWARVAQFLRDLGISVKFSNAELHGMLVQAMASLKVGNRLAGAPRTPAAAARGEPAQQARGELPEQNTLGGWAAPDDTLTDKVIYELQDGRVDLKRVQQAITQATGNVEERFDARLAETLYYGRVTRRTETFLNREAKPLLQAMARIGVTQAELGDYLLARHAPERNEQIARVNPELPDGGAGSNSKGELMTTEAAQAYIEAIPTQRRRLLEELAAYVDRITAGTRELLVAEGLEKRHTIDAWDAAYQHYVPLFKDEAEGDNTPHPQGQGFTVRGPASKRATGSTKEVTNVLGHVLMQREAAITRAEKNRVGLALYGLALANPNREFWTTIKPSTPQALITRELQDFGVDVALARNGMSLVPTIRDVSDVTGEVVDRPNPFYKNLPGAITLRLNGEDRVLMINVKDPRGARLAADLKNLDGLTKMDLAGSIVGKSTRWLAAVNTQYNPAFGLANLTRDTWGGLVNLNSTPLRGRGLKVLADVPKAMQGITRALATNDRGGGEWADLWRQFQDDGGRTGWRQSFRDPNERTRAIEKELQHLEHNGALNPRVLVTRTLHLLDGFNTVLENAVRLAAYKEALNKGMSRPEAARLGRELTVDFNRKGRATRELSPLYAFFNASIQGGARTLETLRGPHGKAIIAGGLTLGVMQALLLLAADYDDDEIPDWVQTRSLIIPLPRDAEGKKRFVAVPYPLGLHVLPNTGRVLTQLGLSGGKDMGKKLVGAVGEIAAAFNPLGGGNVLTAHGALTTVLPTVLDPLADIAANRNFMELPIEREQNGERDNRPGYQRARETTLRNVTGQAYMQISRILNAATGGTAYERGVASPTPERVRYIAETVGGGALREVEKAIDSSAKAMAGDKVNPSGVPIFGRFFGEVDPDRVTENRYRERGTQLDKVQNSLRAAKAAGDGDAMVKMLDQHPEAALIQAHDKVQQHITKLNKLAVSTIDDREMMKTIDEARHAEMRGLNEAFEELEAAQGPTPGQRLKKAIGKVPATAP